MGLPVILCCFRSIGWHSLFAKKDTLCYPSDTKTVHSAVDMQLLNRITFGVLLATGIAFYAGLDKLVSFVLLLTLICLQLLFNKLNRIISQPDSRISGYLNRSGSQSGNERARKFLRILVNLLAAMGSLAVLWQLYLLAQGQNLSVYEPLSHQIICLGAFMRYLPCGTSRTAKNSSICNGTEQ